MKDRLAHIFEKQAELLRSLAPIYKYNEFHIKNAWPYAIDSRDGQEQFRLLAWRITEEVYEALEERSKPKFDVAKYDEEVVDVLHFFVELAICCDIGYEDFATGGEAPLRLREGNDYLEASFIRVQLYPNTMSGQHAWGMFLTALAHLMMKFRQRPWRTDNRPTDFEQVKKFMTVTWFAFCAACVATGITPNDLYQSYFAKNQINEKRRDDNMPEQNSNNMQDDAW